MARFAGEFFPPDLSAPFVAKVTRAAWEILAMSALGTMLAAALGLALALPASRMHDALRRDARNGAAASYIRHAQFTHSPCDNNDRARGCQQ